MAAMERVLRGSWREQRLEQSICLVVFAEGASWKGIPAIFPLCLPCLRFSYTLLTTKLDERHKNVNESAGRRRLLGRCHRPVSFTCFFLPIPWLLAFFILEIQ